MAFVRSFDKRQFVPLISAPTRLSAGLIGLIRISSRPPDLAPPGRQRIRVAWRIALLLSEARRFACDRALLIACTLCRRDGRADPLGRRHGPDRRRCGARVNALSCIDDFSRPATQRSTYRADLCLVLDGVTMIAARRGLGGRRDAEPDFSPPLVSLIDAQRPGGARAELAVALLLPLAFATMGRGHEQPISALPRRPDADDRHDGYPAQMQTRGRSTPAAAGPRRPPDERICSITWQGPRVIRFRGAALLREAECGTADGLGGTTVCGDSSPKRLAPSRTLVLAEPRCSTGPSPDFFFTLVSFALLACGDPTRAA